MKKQLFKLLVTIVDRAKGERIAAICREQGVLFQMVCLGHGTASSEVLDLLGLGRTEKAVVLSLVPGGDVSGIFHAFADKMQILGPGSGIAFSLPLSSIGAALSAVSAKTDEVETKGEKPVMDSAVQKDLVLAVVEPGHTDEAWRPPVRWAPEAVPSSTPGIWAPRRPPGSLGFPSVRSGRFWPSS